MPVVEKLNRPGRGEKSVLEIIPTIGGRFMLSVPDPTGWTKGARGGFAACDPRTRFLSVFTDLRPGLGLAPAWLDAVLLLYPTLARGISPDQAVGDLV